MHELKRCCKSMAPSHQTLRNTSPTKTNHCASCHTTQSLGLAFWKMVTSSSNRCPQSFLEFKHDFCDIFSIFKCEAATFKIAVQVFKVCLFLLWQFCDKVAKQFPLLQQSYYEWTKAQPIYMLLSVVENFPKLPHFLLNQCKILSPDCTVSPGRCHSWFFFYYFQDPYHNHCEPWVAYSFYKSIEIIIILFKSGVTYGYLDIVSLIYGPSSFRFSSLPQANYQQSMAQKFCQQLFPKNKDLRKGKKTSECAEKP